MHRRLDHPVWDVYDFYRTTRLNTKYCGVRLAQYQKGNFWMEFILACTASSSAIAAFALWKTSAGSIVWQWLGAMAAILAILKPLLKLTEKIRSLEEVITGFKIMDIDLQKLIVEIKKKGKYDEGLSQKFQAIFDRMDELIVKFKEHEENKKLIKKCMLSVNEELPPEKFFVPNDK